MHRAFLSLTLVLLAITPALAQTREDKVRADRKKVEADGFWIYNDLEKGFAEPSSEVSKSLASCITESFEEAPQADFEDALLSTSTEGFEELAGDCF